MTTDAIAEMLTKIRNANMARHERVDIPASKLKLEITKILKDKGFIKAYKVLKDNRQNTIRISLKYVNDNGRVINGIKRISRPGRRVYVGKDEIPLVMGGYGLAILSTPKGVLPDDICRQEGIGGELLCYIW